MKCKIDGRGIAKLAHDPAVGNALLYHAEKALRYARNLPPNPDSGEYRRRMFVKLVRGRRTYAIYGTHSYKGWWIEFGASRRNRPYGTLQKAARLAGMRVTRIAQPGQGRVAP